MTEITEVGACMCKHEPRGDKGLEGYMQFEFYLFQRCVDEKGAYYRLYPTLGADYYETCSERTFSQYFKKEDVDVYRTG